MSKTHRDKVVSWAWLVVSWLAQNVDLYHFGIAVWVYLAFADMIFFNNFFAWFLWGAWALFFITTVASIVICENYTGPELTDRIECVYIFRRNRDGIYKVGKTNHLARRYEQLKQIYGPLTLVCYFPSQNIDKHENIALNLTSDYFHQDGKHKELRKMTHVQLRWFMAEFSKRIYQ